MRLISHIMKVYPNTSSPNEINAAASLLPGVCVGVLQDDKSMGAALVELLKVVGYDSANTQ